MEHYPSGGAGARGDCVDRCDEGLPFGRTQPRKARCPTPSANPYDTELPSTRSAPVTLPHTQKSLLSAAGHPQSHPLCTCSSPSGSRLRAVVADTAATCWRAKRRLRGRGRRSRRSGSRAAAGRGPWDAKHPTQARRTEKFPSSKFPPYHTTPRPKPQAFPHKKIIEKTNKPAAHFGILSANRTKSKNFQKRIAKFHSTW